MKCLGFVACFRRSRRAPSQVELAALKHHGDADR